MKLKIIIPVNTDAFTGLIRDAIQPVLTPEMTVDIEPITAGTPYIESRVDLAMNAPHVIELAKRTESEGYDGIFVTDMDMCGVEASRQVVSIPIIGGFRASAYTAMMLAQRFSIITVSNVLDLQNEHIRAFGIVNNLASIRPLDIRVPNLADPNQHKKILDDLTRQAMLAIEQDGADSIMFGCTGFINFARDLEAALKEKIGKVVPVMDPNCCAISYLALLVKNKLSQSQITYPLQN